MVTFHWRWVYVPYYYNEIFLCMHAHQMFVYWSKVLTDQPGSCQFFRKYKIIVNNLKRATIKQVIILLSKLLKFIFRKSHFVTFLLKTLNVPCRNTRLQYPVYWTFNITRSSIGFEWKKKCCFVSPWLLFVLRFIRGTFSMNGLGVSLPTSISSISIQCMVA